MTVPISWQNSSLRPPDSGLRKELQDLISDLRQPEESKEIRFKITNADFKAYGQSVLEDLQTAASSQEGWEIVAPNHEGIRVACTSAGERGWFLLRQSLHDPVLPLNIESDVGRELRISKID